MTIARVPRAIWHAYLLFALVLGVSAQGGLPQKPPELETSAIEARQAAIKDSTLGETERATATANYSNALDLVRTGDAAAEARKSLIAKKADEPRKLAKTREDLGKTNAPATPTVTPKNTLPELERRAVEAEEAAKVASAALRAAEAAIQQRSQRQPQLPALISTVRENLKTIDPQLEALGTDPTLAEPAQSQRILLSATSYSLAQEAAKLEAELQYFTGNEELLTAQRDLAERQSQQADATAKAWQTIVAERRTLEAKKAEKTASAAVENAAAEDRHPLLLEIAKATQALTKRRTTFSAELVRAKADTTATIDLRHSLESDLKDVKQRIEDVGLTDAMGDLLRERRASLPVPRKIRQRIQQRVARRSSLQADRYDLDDERRALTAPDYLDRELAKAVPVIPKGSPVAVEAAALLATRINTLKDLIADRSLLSDAVTQLDNADHLLLAQSLDYTEFVSERVLWVRSTSPIWRPKIDEASKALAFLTSASNWGNAATALANDFAEDSLLLVLATVCWLALMLVQRRVQRGIPALGAIAIKGSTVHFAPTAWTLLLTLIASLPLPTLALIVGWRLDVAPGQGDLAKPIGQALMLCAWPLLALGFFRQVVRPEGLADCHFQWSDQSLRTYRRTLRWLIPIVVLCSFALATLEYLGNVNWKGSLGRPFLILMLLALAVFFRRILNPRTNAKVLAAAITTVWSNRANYAFYALGMIVPGALLVLDLLGFHFTAIQLLLRLAVMVALVSGLFLVHDTVLRALVLTRRKLAIAQATERRKAAAATRADANESNKSSMPIDDPSIDVSSVAEQTRSLLRSLLTLCIAICTWLAWVDVLPALGIFRTEKLWEDITLADAMLAAIVFVMTFLAARNIPGVLQLTLLHRLKVHAGESHAITSIARYLILLIGCLYGFSTLGLGWGKLQWLAAGISVGLGFGLQEIFANFISGLIILLERPIRIGDLVTVKEVDGYVTRIRMRATTIRDYNRKELIIPNKEFVTGSVVNWTLSDSVARLIVRVGVAYGSDLDLTRKLLLEIAAAERLVLPKPKTKALFRGFGDSTLDFELRIFIGDVDDSPEVLDRILSQIDARFKAAKIEIAFPQRDLHLRTVTPLIEALGQRDSALRASPSDAPERPSELT